MNSSKAREHYLAVRHPRLTTARRWWHGRNYDMSLKDALPAIVADARSIRDGGDAASAVTPPYAEPVECPARCGFKTGDKATSEGRAAAYAAHVATCTADPGTLQTA